MKRLILAAAVLAMAGCADGGSNPVSAEGSTPALSGTALPNLYVSQITTRVDANGALTARIRVCNNGTAPAGTSRTYLEHWAGLYYEIYDIYTTGLAAGLCTTVSSPQLMDTPGVAHSYYTKADEYLVVQESNEDDNEKELHVYP